MKPYPKNNINFIPITPVYIKNNTPYQESRYSIYRIVDNLPKDAFEIKLTNSISRNSTYNGYYYTTSKNETLYEIAKLYYGSESYYWILAKANGIKNKGLSVIPANTTIVIPNFADLQKQGGYFNL